MKKKVKTRKKITLQSVIMYILLILTALMFATRCCYPFVFIKTKVEIFAKPFSWPEVPQWSNYVEAWTSANMSHYVFKQFDSGRSDSDRTCDRVYNGSLRTVQI